MEAKTYPDGKTPNICIIGAGFSGLTAAIQLKRQLNLKTFTIFDENHEVGGTWLVNTYPGCACDVPSHFYSWSFEPNPDWTESYSSQEEIWTYMMATAAKYDLYPHIKFNTQVKGLVWDEDIKQWRVTIRDKETRKEKIELFDVVINGPGILRQPNYPTEFANFKGPIIHSAEWDATTELQDKVVGIVGSGASAVQIIPSISPLVKELHCYQRKPAWVRSKGLYEVNKTTRWIFKYVPFVQWLYRCFLFLTAEFFWYGLVHKSWISKKGREGVISELKHEVPDKKLQEKLIPNYQFGCKRITFADNYLQAFKQSHVQLHTEKITAVLDNKLLTADGTSQKIDVLILATGFNVQNYFDPMTLVGKHSTDVMSQWKNDGPDLLYGIVGANLPNHFILLGPNTGLGHSSVVFIIECQVNFAIQVIHEMMRTNTRCVTVKPRVVDDYMRDLEKQMKKMVWGNEDCGSWYADSRGKVTALFPWNSTTYWRRTRKVDPSQFEFTN